MKISNRYSLSVAALALLSIPLVTGCSTTMTAQEKTAFTNMENGLAFHPKKVLQPSAAKRIPLQAGQWALISTRPREEDKPRTLMKYKVLKVEGTKVTMEIESRSSSAKPSLMAYVVDHYPTQSEMSMTKEQFDKHIDDLTFERIIFQSGDSKPTEVPTNITLLTKQYIKNVFTGGYRTGDVTYTACGTPELTSTRCYTYNYQAEALGFSMKGTVHAHGGVPIVGFIDQTSDQGSSRVIAYGFTGATGTLIH